MKIFERGIQQQGGSNQIHTQQRFASSLKTIESVMQHHGSKNHVLLYFLTHEFKHFWRFYIKLCDFIKSYPQKVSTSF